ncbi:hypothetical protein LQW54_012346 [Pestalotiopsis sp. IQ-011]
MGLTSAGELGLTSRKISANFSSQSDGCLSTCDRKADCNPGWDSSEFSNAEKCPLNVCCSDYGFCGTTEEFCGDDDTVKRPSCSVGDTEVTRVIGYYESWSTSKRSCYSMLPEKIPYGYYTHLIFSFATIDPDTFKIIPGGSQTEAFMQRIGAIKLMQPDIKIWVAIGGWAFNDPGVTQTTFSDLAASSAATDTFIDSLIKMMNTYGFDGIDIDWEYPAADDRSGRPEDFENFVTFISRVSKKLRDGSLNKGVSLTLPSSFWYLRHFDIVQLQEHVDWFNVMSYDIHGSWDIDNKHTGPYANAHTNLTEIQDALDLLWRNDIDPQKITLGMSYYSRSFTLVDSACNVPGCLVTSGGNAGECSETTGVLLHPEIQDIIKEHNLSPTLYRDAAVKTVSWGDQWVSFDDTATWRLKANLARGQCIPGVMVWAISQDDANATNAKGLTAAVGRTVLEMPDFTQREPVTAEPATTVGLCRWSGCYKDCPSGFKTVQRDGHDEIMLTSENCLDGGMDKLCCPSDAEMPKCTWRGHKNSGVCSPGCDDGEVEVGTLRVGCNFHHQSACCTNVAAVKAWGECKWFGSAPICHVGGGDASCGSDYPNKIFSSKTGEGGEQPCTDGSKVFCCKDPTPSEFSNGCDWHTKGSPARFEQDFICEDSCPDGQIKLATEVGGMYDQNCFGGSRAYCCDPPKAAPLSPRGDPFGSTQTTEFRMLIEKYMLNPSCPATILHPSLGDLYSTPMPSRRSLEFEAREYEVLHGRATDCTSDTWVRLLQYLDNMYSASVIEMTPFIDVYNDLFAGPFDTELEYASISSFQAEYPSIDPHSLNEYVMYNGYIAGNGLRQARRMAETFCELPSSSSSSRRNVASHLGARRIWVWEAIQNGIPSMHSILEGILSGDLSLHYARWQRDRSGLLLEVAYWIGPQPGMAGGSDAYRDAVTQGNGAVQDNWAVFHFHINFQSDVPWLRQINGRTYVGVTHVRVFHAQITNQVTGAWRVDSMDGRRNARDGFDCPESLESGFWYVGAPRDNLPDDDDGFYNTFHNWGVQLFESGYLASQAVSLILRGPNYIGDDIDPNNYGSVLNYGATSDTTGGNPYDVNWTLHPNGLGFNFFPEPPPHE